MKVAKGKLQTDAMNFAIDIVKLCDSISGHSALTNQMLRSGTSIGANIYEANYAHSRADFIAKLQIALKECYETDYWLTLLLRTDIISAEQGQGLLASCGTLRRMLISSIKTAKENET